MNDELKAKYGRIANDPSQLEMFKNDQIDTISALQQAVEGKIALDGIVTLEHNGPDYGLPANSVTKPGIYKVKYSTSYYGFMIVSSLTTEPKVLYLGGGTKYSAIWVGKARDYSNRIGFKEFGICFNRDIYLHTYTSNGKTLKFLSTAQSRFVNVYQICVDIGYSAITDATIDGQPVIYCENTGQETSKLYYHDTLSTTSSISGSLELVSIDTR